MNKTLNLLSLTSLILCGCGATSSEASSSSSSNEPVASSTTSEEPSTSERSSSEVPTNYVQPYIEDMIMRPGCSSMKIRAHSKDGTGVVPPILDENIDFNSRDIEISNGVVTAKKVPSRGTPIEVTIAFPGFNSVTFTITIRSSYPGFGDGDFNYRKDDYVTKGSPTNYTCFMGDSWFDDRYYYTTFYDTYGESKAYCGGVGGAQTHDMRILFNEWVVAEHAKQICLNISCNNIDNAGEDGTTAYWNLWCLLEDIKEYLPTTKVLVWSISPELGLISNWPKAQASNKMSKAYCEANSTQFTYFPVGEAIRGHEEEYTTVKDGVHNDGGMHPSQAGYRFIENMLNSYITIDQK